MLFFAWVNDVCSLKEANRVDTIPGLNQFTLDFEQITISIGRPIRNKNVCKRQNTSKEMDGQQWQNNYIHAHYIFVLTFNLNGNECSIKPK